jgi:hypothetical protein
VSVAALAACGRNGAGPQPKATGHSYDAGKAVSASVTKVIDRSDREGTWPVVCEVVGRADFTTPGGAALLVGLQQTAAERGQDGLLGGLGALGMDALRDLRGAVLCKIAARGLAEREMGVAVSGAFPADLMAKIARGNNTFRSDVVDGTPALAKERFWIAQRGGGEVVFATSAGLLSRFLTGPVQRQEVKGGAALSVSISGPSLTDAVVGRRGVRAREFDAVRRLVIDLAPDGTSLAVRAETRDASAAQKLGDGANDFLNEWWKRMANGGRARPELAVQVQGDSVVMRAKLPPEALASAFSTLVRNSGVPRLR